jgi:hypothetical protein
MTNGNTEPRGAIQTPVSRSHSAPLRAVDYVRVSTEEQKKRYGLAGQSRKNLRDRIMTGPVLDGALTFRGEKAKCDVYGNLLWGGKRRDQAASNPDR